MSYLQFSPPAATVRPARTTAVARAGIWALDASISLILAALSWAIGRTLYTEQFSLGSVLGSALLVLFLAASFAIAYGIYNRAVEPSIPDDLALIAVPVILVVSLALSIHMLASEQVNAPLSSALLVSVVTLLIALARRTLTQADALPPALPAPGRELRPWEGTLAASFPQLAAHFAAAAGLRACSILTHSADAGALVLRGSACASSGERCDGARRVRFALHNTPVLAGLMQTRGWLWLDPVGQPALCAELPTNLLCSCVTPETEVALAPLVFDGEAHGLIVVVHQPVDAAPERLRKLSRLVAVVNAQRESLRQAIGDHMNAQLKLPLTQLLLDLPFPLALINRYARVIMLNPTAAEALGPCAADLPGKRLCQRLEDCPCPIHVAARSNERIASNLQALLGSVAADVAAVPTTLWRIGGAGTAGQYVALTFGARSASSEALPSAELAAMIAHDLRSPLTALYLNSQLALESDLPETDRTRLLGNISRQVKRLDQVAVDLIDAYRTTRQPDRSRQPVNLRELALEVVDEQRQFGAGDRVVEVAICDSLMAPADEAQLRIVLRNLVGNAIRYTEGEQPIVITAERAGGEVRVTVSDHGPGVPESEAPFVFDRFYRARPASGRPAGHGIGLFAARRLVELHGGRIWLESEPGEGCRFIFTLPAMPQVVASVG